jgi:AcrR family transcriptional regulator
VRRVADPAYTRMPVDERRRQLLELSTDLFTRHSFGELSMSRIAREAGISKALLYHYFPSKEAFFRATLARGAEELGRLTEADPSRPAAEQLAGALDAYLRWIEGHDLAYRKLLRSVGAVPALREFVDEIRASTADRIVAGLEAGGPRVRAAVIGWLWLVDGATLQWLDRGGFEREELHEMLLGALLGAVTAAGGRVALEA